jgi:amino acid permease
MALERSAGIVFGTTVGAGIFALPYIFSRAGLIPALSLLFVFSLIVSFCHILYLRIVAEHSHRASFLSLLREAFGRGGELFGIFAIVGGLFLTLCAYVLLAASFFRFLWPAVDFPVLVCAAMAFLAFPLFFRLRATITMQLFGNIFMVVFVALFFLQNGLSGLSRLPLFGDAPWVSVLAPFLFALAGWTAVEPVFDSSKRVPSGTLSRGMTVGTIASAIFYLLFVLAVAGVSGIIAEDTISGAFSWQFWQWAGMAVFGLFAIWTSYIPTALQIETILSRDLKIPFWVGRAGVVAGPLLVVALGLSSFVAAVGIVGGIFLSAEYLAILAVVFRLSSLTLPERLAAYACGCVFLIAAALTISGLLL